MIRDSKSFLIGLVMLVSFLGIYAYMMSPSFGNGRNGLEFADDMFNSISKGSVKKVIVGEIKKAENFNDKAIDVSIKAPNDKDATQWATLYKQVEGTVVSVDNKTIKLQGDQGKIMACIAEDCLAMYDNKGDLVKQKYGMDPREAVYGWYNSTKQISKALDKQEKFNQSLGLQSFQKKIIEPSYNYYGVDAKQVADNKGSMTFMMVFYLVYTLWYGFAIYFLCIGLGITMTKATKKSEA